MDNQGNLIIFNKLAEIAKKKNWRIHFIDLEKTDRNELRAELKAGGKVMLEADFRPREKYASLTIYAVEYGSLGQTYTQGKIDQFSPFDDNNDPVPTKLSVEDWLIKSLDYFLENSAIGWVK